MAERVVVVEFKRTGKVGDIFDRIAPIELQCIHIPHHDPELEVVPQAGETTEVGSGFFGQDYFTSIVEPENATLTSSYSLKTSPQVEGKVAKVTIDKKKPRRTLTIPGFLTNTQATIYYATKELES